YRIYARNVRLQKDEIDIVAYDPQERSVVFAEVKTRARTSKDFRPELNITRAKKEHLLRAARAWVALHEYEGSFRLDLICVAEGQVIHHVKDMAVDCE
ncbi:MAG: YraN family protein, partial [Candidatus Peribacteraceae bacterium]